MSLFNELKRRNVFRVGLAYLVSAWVIAQVADLVLDNIDAPPWVMQALLLVLGLGFIIALVISWAYELTPEGLKKDADVSPDASIANHTAKKLDYITIIAASIVLGLFVYQQINPSSTASQVDDENLGQAEMAQTETPADVQITEQAEVQAIDNKSIAVLPFTNMANNPENEPFTLGLHDDLLTHLSRISALKVISRTSVMEYKDTTKKIKDIAQELGVANILEGGVQRSGNQIRLNVQLIDAATDEHLWAEIYDRELTTDNIFSIQTEVSKAIAKALKAQLTTAENISIETAPTDNLAAYDAYLAARQLIEKRESGPLKQALVLFKKASELDPNYALAYVGQALTLHLLISYSELTRDELAPQIGPLLDQALEINPLLAEAHAVKGIHLSEQGKTKQAEASFKLSLGLNPNLAETYHFYGHMLRDIRPAESLALHRKAVELDPLSNVVLANLGWVLREIGNEQEALEVFKKLHQLNPEFPAGLQGIAWINDDMGNYAQAIIHQQQGIDLDPSNITTIPWLIIHYLNINDITAAQDELVQAKKIAASHWGYRYLESMLHMFSGDYEAAQQVYVSALEGDPENTFLQRDVARFSMISAECGLSVQLWQSAAPEMFEATYELNNNNLFDVIDLTWCLKQTKQEQIADRLLAKLQTYSVDDSNKSAVLQFSDAGIYAIQDKPKQAAQAYADVVASKRTRGWYMIDHRPYYAEMRKQPVFIQARKQLMRDLAEQRALLAEYRKTGKLP